MPRKLLDNERSYGRLLSPGWQKTRQRRCHCRAQPKCIASEAHCQADRGINAPVEQEMRLSDAFMTDETECGTISLEVVVKFINVNYEKGAELLTRCKTMQGYSVLIYKIREKQKAHGNLAAAIEESIRECESEGILADFLKEHGGEIMSFLFEKMSREECEAVREADGFAAGYEQGEAAEKRVIAANFKKAGIDIDVIAANTGLTAEEIEKL